MIAPAHTLPAPSELDRKALALWSGMTILQKNRLLSVLRRMVDQQNGGAR